MKIVIIFLLLICNSGLVAQDATSLLKDASNLEKGLKEREAFEKYKAVLETDSVQIRALIKCSELASNFGARSADKKEKMEWLEASRKFAAKAYTVDSNNAEVCFTYALVLGKSAEVETDNKKLAMYFRAMKQYADRAVFLKPGWGKANFIKGKWHYDRVHMPWTRSSSLKIFFGGLEEGKTDSIYYYMEKCRVVEPYFMANFFYLAKAYKADDKPEKAIELLNALIKLPIRCEDDQAFKAEGKLLLSEMQ